MIVDAIFRAIAAPFSFIIGTFPDITPPSWACNSAVGGVCLPAKAAGLSVYLGAANRFVPLSEAFTLFEYFIGVLLGVMAFRAGVFVYGLVRGA